MCPHCNAMINTVRLRDVTVTGGAGTRQWRGIAYCCNLCQKVLSVSIDPIALKTDTIEELADRLGR
jgi:hypothetical protein